MVKGKDYSTEPIPNTNSQPSWNYDCNHEILFDYKFVQEIRTKDFDIFLFDDSVDMAQLQGDRDFIGSAK